MRVYVLIWSNWQLRVGCSDADYNLIGVFTTLEKAKAYADWNAETKLLSIKWEENIGDLSDGNSVYVQVCNLNEADELF